MKASTPSLRFPDGAGIALCVALGTGLGSVARVGLDALMIEWLGRAFPFGVLAVNVLGSFAIGFIATLTRPEGRILLAPGKRQFLLGGICGGFTTFSFFSLQTVQLLTDERLLAAGLYATLTLTLALAAVWVGHAAAAKVNRVNS